MTNPDQVRRDYQKGILLYCGAYAVALFASIYAIKHFSPPIPVRILLALVTALPIGGTFLVLLKYIREVDEFLRAKTIKTFISATGLTFFLATLWGFLENYEVAQHLEFWLIYPVFWACVGLVGGGYKVSEK